jgi:sn-glycerol 3-phosphate transport system substrate-binding protein
MSAIHRLTTLLFICLTSFGEAQTTLEYWHSQDATESTIQTLADTFNASQGEYRVVPRYVGSYREGTVKLIAALGGGEQPVLFDAEGTVFARLVEERALADLSDLTDALPEALVEDLYPALWSAGKLNGGRYGLPWNMSMPVLFYNATAFAQLGVTPPKTWAEFEEVAARLTTRQTEGYIHVSAAFIFEMMVSTRGGSIVTEAGQPNLNSPEAVDALNMLKRIADGGNATLRSFAELDVALVDFVRTKGMMAFASIAFWPQGLRYSVAFEPATAPVPTGASAAVPLMGAQMVVLESASEAERRGAVAFWEFLMEPENVVTWVQASYFLPARRSALPLLEPWYQEDPNRKVALSQLENAVPRPRVGAYAVWQGFLEEALEKSLRGGVPPEVALAEAQQRALESR